MIQQVYKLDPGVCTCQLGDPVAGAVPVNIRKLSGSEAVLDPTPGLRENQFVYLTLKFLEGPSLSLGGIVVTSASGGIFVQWSHARPSDADRVDEVVRRYLKEREALLQSQAGGPGPPEMEAPREEASAPAPAPSGAPTLSTPSPLPVALPELKKPPAPSPGGSVRLVAPILLTQAKAAATEAVTLEASAPEVAQRDTAKSAAMKGSAATRKPSGPSPSPRGSARIPRREGGELDVSATLRERSKVVRSEELASRHELVRILNFETIHGLIREAVEESAALVNSRMGDEERRRFVQEAEASFQEKLAAFKAEKAGLEEKTRLLQGQLEKASQLLQEERTRVVSASQFTVSDEGMIVLEQRLGRLMDHALKGQKVTPELVGEMRAVVAALLDEERDKIRAQAEKTQSETIELLEKKVKRLASSLDDVARERDKAQRRAQALEAAGGAPAHNIREAGLAEDDPAHEKKLDLLKEIFKINQAVRADLAQRGVVLKARNRPQPGAEPADPSRSAPLAPTPSSATTTATAEAPRQSSGEASRAPPDVGTVAQKEEQALAASLGIQRKGSRHELKTERIESRKVSEAIAAEFPIETTEEREEPKEAVVLCTDAADPDALWEPDPQLPGVFPGGSVRRLG